MSEKKQMNIRNLPIEPCSFDPLTGFYRNGCCDTGDNDRGIHTVCVILTEEFLVFSKRQRIQLYKLHALNPNNGEIGETIDMEVGFERVLIDHKRNDLSTPMPQYDFPGLGRKVERIEGSCQGKNGVYVLIDILKLITQVAWFGPTWISYYLCRRKKTIYCSNFWNGSF